MIIDTHTHLLDEKFSADREEVIENLAGNGVCAIVENGTNITDSKKAVLLAQSHKNIYAAVGIHPHDASTATPQIFAELKALTRENKVVAIGEIGLDYHYDFSPREAQRTAPHRTHQRKDEDSGYCRLYQCREIYFAEYFDWCRGAFRGQAFCNSGSHYKGADSG